MITIYKSSDYFIVRAPSLPINVCFDLLEYKGNLITYMKDKNIYNLVKNMLMVSSKSMYNMLLDIECEKVKYNDTFAFGLKNYLIRASIRATPFGIYAGVGVGSFNEGTNLSIDNKYLIEIKVDNKWICNIVHLLENKENVLDRLSLKFNKNTYISGDRLKNTQISLHGAESENRFNEYSIRNTYLIELIKEFNENYKTFNETLNVIEKSYPEVDKTIIVSTIKNLLDNEFLITNLKQPSYCSNSLECLISTLKSLNLEKEIKIYEEILILIDKLQNNLTIDSNINSEKASSIYCELVDKMSSVFEADNYIYINKGISLNNRNLDIHIKKDLENFISKISKLSFKNNVYENMFCEKVSEVYGYDTLIPLTDIIDTNKLNILNTIDQQKNYNDENDEKIKNIIDFKILQAIKECKDEVELTEDNFKKIIESKEDTRTIDLIKSFDLNIMIKKISESENYQCFVTSNPGSDRSTSIYNRFYEILKSENGYLNVLDTLKRQDYDYEYNNDCIYAEIRELLPDSRSINVRNNIRINNTNLSFSLCENNSDTYIYIRDLYIRINKNNTIDIINLKLGKKIIFIKNDMLNKYGHSKLANLLYNISKRNQSNPINRLYDLFNNKYIFTPRIKFENVIITPKQWCIYEEMFSNIKDYSLFIQEFDNIKNIFKIDRYVYLANSDNRILIDLSNKDFYEHIYKYIKKFSYIKLEEFEFISNDEFILKDQYNNKYISEYSLSFFKADVNNVKEIEIDETYKENIITDSSSFILPFENNWLYYKLYGINGRENEVIRQVEDLFSSLEEASIKFFIRYYDEGGKNLRVRFRFENSKDLMNNLIYINNFFYKLRDKGMIYTASIDTYLPEISRYGGNELIDYVERFFSIDSKFVMSLLKKVNLSESSDVEFYYFLGILSILKTIYSSEEEVMEALNKYTRKGKWRDEYKSNKQRYIHFSEIIFYNDVFSIEKVKYLYPLLEKRNSLLKEVKNKLDRNINVTNIDSIIFSIIHMFCNRFKGNPGEEEKITHFIRYSMRDVYNRKKYYK
ncbi:TPA: thiopeptide-type bacteriocin biosynthesis protein [Clostridioides difficile]|nr:thiopeptide-type bacteriocin biosynthesis protein [Clostridioides difficile]HEK4908320.1 thiopeptide-type bacteriocin biosynthesis protein [Clostridioides difficile]HEK8884065.1 thiopeptide-type bacteriocin biosynthesis protein [Clostridioides difficile]HEK8898650.1 thiopeptide-type bacteriocin biosynthesis protein [Clostridioides difficile]HEK8959287.1 thiopeptide-type bacteriocin biosynthesis protein [Clostridioides difficile]